MRRALPLAETATRAAALYEYGLTAAAMSFHEDALEALQEAVALAPDHAGARRALASLLRLAGRDEAAAAAEPEAGATWQESLDPRTPAELEQLDVELRRRLDTVGEEQRAEHLRAQLLADPLDVAAMRALAHEEHRGEDPITACQLLERALARAPACLAARTEYARILAAQRNHPGVLTQTAILLAAEPDNDAHRLLRANAALQMERFEEAVALYEAILAQASPDPDVLISYGNALRALGRRQESVRAYRDVLAMAPENGGAYFGLSELKADHLGAADILAMRDYLARGVADLGARKYMAYALGQALERAGDYAPSFKAYAFGAAVCQEEAARAGQTYDPAAMEERLARMRRVFSAQNIAARAAPASAAQTTTPIFIIGLPRAGSTLVEQILASHSLVEGTKELPVIAGLTRKIALSRALIAPDVYPRRVLKFSRAELDALGAECLAGIAAYRKTARPFVLDKRPWNWIDAAFIHLILPRAKFIDVRRTPMAAGFAMFKQLLPPIAAFSYDLGNIGHYYRCYADFMDHLDTAMPGAILHVSYESLVEDTEAQIRRMLAYCGLPFEAGCLRFWESDRAVMTPSAEQVRRPIFREGLAQWRHYEAWLGPLALALGDKKEVVPF